MIRDFTDEAKNTLYDQIDSVTPQDGINTALDCLSDIYMYHPQMLQIIGATKNMNDMKTYHEYMLDRNNTSKEKIDIIFDNVEQVESDYRAKMVSLLNYLTASVNYFDRMASMMNTKGSMLLNMSAEQLRAQTTDWGEALYDLMAKGFDVQVNEDNREALEKKLEDLTSNRYNGQKEVSGMKREDVENLVKLYEKLYPMDATNMDKMLETGNNNTLTEIDKLNMKYITYTAAEPYRSVFLAYLDDYEIGSFGGRDDGFSKIKGAYYSSTFDELYFTDTLAAFSTDARGPYTTWFHENGHAIDYNAAGGLSFYCFNFVTYNEAMKKNVTVQDAIYFDVFNNIEDKVDAVINTNILPKANLPVDKSKILDSFRYGGDKVQLNENEIAIRGKVISMYNPDEKEWMKHIKKEIQQVTSTIVLPDPTLSIDSSKIEKSFNSNEPKVQLNINEEAVRLEVIKMYATSDLDDLSGEVNEAAADVYGGVTNLVINVGYGHRGKDIFGNYDYWYDWLGNAKLSQSKELVAEYFSYQITGNEQAIASAQNHFPEACKVLDEMFESLKLIEDEKKE